MTGNSAELHFRQEAEILPKTSSLRQANMMLRRTGSVLQSGARNSPLYLLGTDTRAFNSTDWAEQFEMVAVKVNASVTDCFPSGSFNFRSTQQDGM